MALTVQNVFRKYLDSYLESCACSTEMRRAAVRIRACRTAELGWHSNTCPLGHYQDIAYNSCHHRCCPLCNTFPREQWLDAWKQRLLACPHHHIVFTTPQELVPLWRYNKALFATTLFAAASQSLLELLDDPQFLGARPGLLAALHTWSQTLAAHVHLHVLVTGGGLDADGNWIAAKKDCLLPRKVLMVKFRGKFRAMLLELLVGGKLTLPPDSKLNRWQSELNRLGRVAWTVKLMERYEHGTGVATYLANYLKGGPIGNKRLISDHNGEIKFRYRQPTSEHGEVPRQGTIKLPAHEFISRFLEHVPPKGFQTVRGYGLYSGNQHSRLDDAHRALGSPPPQRPLARISWQAFIRSLGHTVVCTCPVCGAQLISETYRPRLRGPPPRIADDHSPASDFPLVETGAA
jgi:hypothetical protein